MSNPVNSPAHYSYGEIECIDAMQSASTPEEFRGYCKLAAFKYLWRAGRKGASGPEDLRKAVWYTRMANGDDPREDEQESPELDRCGARHPENPLVFCTLIERHYGLHRTWNLQWNGGNVRTVPLPEDETGPPEPDLCGSPNPGNRGMLCFLPRGHHDTFHEGEHDSGTVQWDRSVPGEKDNPNVCGVPHPGLDTFCNLSPHMRGDHARGVLRWEADLCGAPKPGGENRLCFMHRGHSGDFHEGTNEHGIERWRRSGL